MREPLEVVAADLAGARGGIEDGVAVPGVGDARRELLDPVQRLEVVAERVGTRVRIEADGGCDLAEDRVSRDHHSVSEQHDVAVRMTAQDLDAPAVDLVPRIEQLRPFDPVHRRHQPLGLSCDPVDRQARHAVRRPVRDEPLGITTAPSRDALVVVLTSLQHQRAGQLLDVAGAADVVRMHMRDDDLLDRSVELVEHGPPLRFRIAGAEAGVHEDPAAGRRA